MKKVALLFLLFMLLFASLSLAACSGIAPESVSEAAEDQQTEVMIPVIQSDPEEEIEDVSDDQAYPYPYPDPQIAEYAYPGPEIETSPLGEAYPAPELETQGQSDAADTQVDPYPAPQEEPTQEIKPTPRGSQLVATDPSLVKLASGQLQLVELFAFW